MTIEEQTYYFVRCDGCGNTPSDEGSEYAAWADVNSVMEEADASDWKTVEDKHFCCECKPVVEDDD